MWRDLSRSNQPNVVLPDIVGERCVHALAEQASCRACVDVCPRDAWFIDEELLGIDPDLCDGCDLCVPACPQGVIERRFSPTVKRFGDHGAAFLRCERSGIIGGTSEGLVPCLHAIGTIDLLELSRLGVDYLIVSNGDCDSCSRGKAERLAQRVLNVNSLLSAREIRSIKFCSLDGDLWQQTFHKISEASEQQGLSRRAFFSKVAEVPDVRLHQALTEDSNKYSPPGVLLPKSRGTVPLPIVVEMEASRCSGCDACVRLCPHQAIDLQSENGMSIAYRIASEKCSGCGLCLDVCEQNALAISRWNLISNTRIPLRMGKCGACGVAFHVPEIDQALPPLCRICSQTDHHLKLYQVFD